MSLLDTDHFDGIWTKLVARLITALSYGVDEHEILWRLKAEGVPSTDAWLALAAAKVEIACPAVELADAIDRDYAERAVSQLFTVIGGA